jgi:hypothetical protein
MASGLDEKRKSLNNSKHEVLDARVIANYGDPGLDEDYHFDILSRFVIVMIESSYRIPMLDRWNKMFAVVARPQPLWINVEDSVANSPTAQKRSDAIGNVSIGAAESFSTAGIPKLNSEYTLGELIKIKKLASPLKLGEDSIFTSQFPFNANQLIYNNWHNEGATLSYFAGNQSRIDGLKWQTIYQNDPNNANQYLMRLYKYQYEAFILTLTMSNTNLSAYLQSVFDNTLSSASAIYDAHGGYIFQNNDYVSIQAVEYEDINVANKQRINSNECMPLIVATPNTFPTPKVRAIGTINYNPTYATIVKQ